MIFARNYWFCVYFLGEYPRHRRGITAGSQDDDGPMSDTSVEKDNVRALLDVLSLREYLLYCSLLYLHRNIWILLDMTAMIISPIKKINQTQVTKNKISVHIWRLWTSSIIKNPSCEDTEQHPGSPLLSSSTPTTRKTWKTLPGNGVRT